MSGPVRQQIDQQSFEQYITRNVPDIKIPITLKQFGFGQSNPTYQITDANKQRFVLRKKPPGRLVSSTAHNVGREFLVLRALEQTDVPVPKTYIMCDDESVIGTPFYIMEFLDGRIFEDPTIPNVSIEERREVYVQCCGTHLSEITAPLANMNGAIRWHQAISVLVKLHSVHLPAVGLADYGKRGNFYTRQVNTWRRIHESQGSVVDVETGQSVGPLPYMSEMLEFFSDPCFQPKDRATLIHGDYKIDNLVFHKEKPVVIGILDWEMSTIGHPLSDLSNLLQPFRIAMEGSLIARQLRSPLNLHDEFPGIPPLSTLLGWYSEEAGWEPSPEIGWSDAFALFRGAVVRQGIAARHAARQASGSVAYEYGQSRTLMALITQKAIAKIKSMGCKSRNGKL